MWCILQRLLSCTDAELGKDTKTIGKYCIGFVCLFVFCLSWIKVQTQGRIKFLTGLVEDTDGFVTANQKINLFLVLRNSSFLFQITSFLFYFFFFYRYSFKISVVFNNIFFKQKQEVKPFAYMHQSRMFQRVWNERFDFENTETSIWCLVIFYQPKLLSRSDLNAQIALVPLETSDRFITYVSVS